MHAFTASLSFSNSRGSASESIICSVGAVSEALLACYACRWPSPRCVKRVRVLEGEASACIVMGGSVECSWALRSCNPIFPSRMQAQVIIRGGCRGKVTCKGTSLSSQLH